MDINLIIITSFIVIVILICTIWTTWWLRKNSIKIVMEMDDESKINTENLEVLDKHIIETKDLLETYNKVIDEKTAELLIRKHLKKNNGTAYLIDNVEREVVINGYIIDPNRIFTNDGVKQNIIKLNNNISKSELNKTIELINKDRDEFFEKISPPKGGLLIALHNNIREYSIENEIPLSTEVSLKKNSHPDHHNFFICTNRDDYNLLKESPFNVVLQDKQIEYDDGSLSWFALRKNIRFINIETRLGYLSTQSKMLKYINENLF